jgi:uncharacterized lipoprotein
MMRMKKFILATMLLALITACGGSSDSSVSQDTSIKNQLIYGFDARGAAYAARLDQTNGYYQYSKVDTKTGDTSSTVTVKITPLPDNAKIYSVYGHGDHLLALGGTE